MDCHIDVYVTDLHFEEEMGNVSYCFIIISCCVLQIYVVAHAGTLILNLHVVKLSVCRLIDYLQVTSYIDIW